MWLIHFISNALYFLFLYVCLPILGIILFGIIWPHIAGIVKFFLIGCPVALAIMMFCYGDIGSGILLLLIGLAAAILPLLVCRLFDRLFGILMTKEEAQETAEEEMHEIIYG